MRGIVRSLLDFGRQSEAEMAEQDVAELIRTSLDLVTSWRGARGIDIQWSVADPPP